MPVDPVCKMEISESGSPTTRHQGKTYYFCCPVCKGNFEKNPEKFIS